MPENFSCYLFLCSDIVESSYRKLRGLGFGEKMMLHALLMIFFIMTLGCDARYGVMESEFSLAQDSCLPKWFVLTKSHNREDVMVTLAYYRKVYRPIAVITVKSSTSKETVFEMAGDFRAHPINEKREGYPHYYIVTINNLVEIVEHRQMEPIFYINDDPLLYSMIDKRIN